MNALVLGAGPVGLLSAYVLRVPCVGERVGGCAEVRRLAPSVLWYLPALAGVLEGLGLPVDLEEVRFGFWGPRGVTSDVTPSERAEYLRRSGRDPDAPTVSALSSGAAGSLLCFRTPVDALCDALARRVELYVGRVSAVSVNYFEKAWTVLLGSRELRASLLVNSLPAPAFDRLLGAGGGFPRTWDAGSKWFVRGQSAWADPLRVARDAGLRWLYVTDPRIPFDRATVLPDGEGFAYEFNSEPPSWFFGAVYGDVPLGPLPLQVYGEPRPAVEFWGLLRNVGRLARWDHRIRLHDVAEELLSAHLG